MGRGAVTAEKGKPDKTVKNVTIVCAVVGLGLYEFLLSPLIFAPLSQTGFNFARVLGAAAVGGLSGFVGLLIGRALVGRRAPAQSASGIATRSPGAAPRGSKPPATTEPVRPTVFPDSAPGHQFNDLGVCLKCGCGRSAGARPCVRRA